MKKLLALLLALVTVTALFACGGKKDDGKKDDPNDPTTESTQEEIKLPEKDYDGKEYRVSVHDGYGKREIFVPEDSNDPLESSVWNRNQIVQDQFNCTITPLYTTATGSIHAHANEVAGFILADQDELDILNTYICSIGSLVIQNLLLDWSQFDNTHLDQSWWTQSINDKFMIEDHIYTPVGATNITSLLYVMPVLMNRNLAEREGIYDDVISTIKDGDWTFDYFNNLVATLDYDDIDNEAGPTDGDFYAFQGEGLTILDMYQFAFDIPMIESDPDRVLKFSWGQGDYREKLSNAVDMVLELYCENPGARGHFGNSGKHINAFKADKAIFTQVRFLDVFNTIKDMESTYTCLPWFKYDENQEDYLCGMGDNYTQMCMPVTVNDSEFVSIITEAMNMYAEQKMWPAFYEDALRTKYQDDPESFEMIEILMKGRTADLGVPFNTSVGCSTMFRNVINKKTNDILQQIDGTVDNKMDAVVDIVTQYRNSSRN